MLGINVKITTALQRLPLLFISFLLVTIAKCTITNVTDSSRNNNTTATTFTTYLISSAPYIWKQDEQITGIIPQLIRVVEKECPQFRMNVKLVDWSLGELNQIIASDDPLKMLRDKPEFNETTTMEHIILGTTNYNNLDIHGNRFKPVSIIHSNGLAGVVHRDSIGIGLKLYHAMLDSMLIIYNGILVTIIVGALVWCLVSSKLEKNHKFTLQYRLRAFYFSSPSTYNGRVHFEYRTSTRTNFLQYKYTILRVFFRTRNR